MQPQSHGIHCLFNFIYDPPTVFSSNLNSSSSAFIQSHQLWVTGIRIYTVLSITKLLVSGLKMLNSHPNLATRPPGKQVVSLSVLVSRTVPSSSKYILIFKLFGLNVYYAAAAKDAQNATAAAAMTTVSGKARQSAAAAERRLGGRFGSALWRKLSKESFYLTHAPSLRPLWTFL